MMTVEELIRNSQCFGIAFDGGVPECKTCDVKEKCKAKCTAISQNTTSFSAAMRPMPTLVAEVSEITTKSEPREKPVEVATPKAAPSKPKAKPKKTVKEAATAKNYSPDMPEFKTFSLEQLEQMAAERGANLDDFKKFTAPNIKRMRLTMFLKKTYEI